MLQLLVKLLTQPGEFVRVAEVVGMDFLVVRPAEGPVGGQIIGGWAVPPLLRAAGLLVALGRRGLLVLSLFPLVFGGLALDLLRLLP